VKTDYANYPVLPRPRPALGLEARDPIFGSRITRVTDPSMMPDDQGNLTTGLRHEYARYPGVSADGATALLVVMGGACRGQFQVLELASGRVVDVLSVADGDAEASWHPTDPRRLFYRSGQTAAVRDVVAGTDVATCPFPTFETVSTHQEGRPADDWRTYACIGTTRGRASLVVAELETGKIRATQEDVGDPNWISMSPSGEYVVAQWADGRGTQVYDRDLAHMRTLIHDHPHCDFALDADGEEVLVYQASSGQGVAELGCPNAPNGSPMACVRLADGARRIVLGECNTRDWRPVVTGAEIGWWFGTHFSGIASRAHPGWVLVSTYTEPRTQHYPFSREIFWLKLDGSGEVRRIAHHHSDQASHGGEKDYWAEPHATSSWDGDLVVFSSVWETPWENYDFYTCTGDWWD